MLFTKKGANLSLMANFIALVFRSCAFMFFLNLATSVYRSLVNSASMSLRTYQKTLQRRFISRPDYKKSLLASYDLSN